MTTKTLPPGCKCNPHYWLGDAAITPICEEYTASTREGCYYCGHRLECHVFPYADTDAADDDVDVDTVDNRELDNTDVDEHIHHRRRNG